MSDELSSLLQVYFWTREEYQILPAAPGSAIQLEMEPRQHNCKGVALIILKLRVPLLTFICISILSWMYQRSNFKTSSYDSTHLLYREELTVVCSLVFVAVVPQTTISGTGCVAFVNFFWFVAQFHTFLQTFAAFVLVQIWLIVWVGYMFFTLDEVLLFLVVGHDMHTDGAMRAHLFCSVNYCLHLWSQQYQLGSAIGSIIPIWNSTK